MSFTEPLHVLLHLAGFAAMVSLAISGFMISAGLLDRPVARSSHENAIPTAGGLGVVAGVGAGLLALAMFYPELSNQRLLAAMSALLLGVGFVGLVDDIYDTNAQIKFLVMIVLAVTAVMTIGPPTSFPVSILSFPLPYWFAFSGAVLWVFVLTNGVNFMDGANGLMGSFMAISLMFLAVIAVMFDAMNTAILSMLIAAAIMGFLPYNWRKRALIFSGDVGALFVGFGFAICVLLLLRETRGAGLLYVGPLLVLPFLTDILMTMLARAKRKENLMSAHSSHLYHRLIKSGRSHMAVSRIYAASAIIAGLSALIGVKTDLHRSVFYLGFAVCFWVLIYLIWHQKLPNGRGPQQK